MGVGRMSEANTDKVSSQSPAAVLPAVLREVAAGLPVFLWCFVDFVLFLSPEICVRAPSCRRKSGWVSSSIKALTRLVTRRAL